MGKRDAFWATIPEDAEGNVAWPEDHSARERIARDMVGATVVGAVEAICSERLETVAGNMPAPGAAEYQLKVANSRLFASMSEEQRGAAREAVLDACFGSLYWILVKLEHFKGASVDITARPFNGTGDELPPCSIEGDSELHWLYFDWLEKFSDLRKP